MPDLPFDFWTEGRTAAKHLQTLFWMGGSICHFVLRWRGRASPEVAERFKTSFQQLRLQEEWIVDVGEKDTQGISVFISRCHAGDQLPSSEEQVTATKLLWADEQITATMLEDFRQIMLWLNQFDDTPSRAEADSEELSG